MHRFTTAFFLVLILLVTMCDPAAIAAGKKQELSATQKNQPVSELTVVRLADGADPRAAAREMGVTPVHVYSHVFTGFAAKLPAAAMSRSRDNRQVKELSPDYQTRLASKAKGKKPGKQRPAKAPAKAPAKSPAKPKSAEVTSTGLTRIGLPASGGVGENQSIDADIAILDSGVSNQKDLNIVNSTNCTTEGSSDTLGHGTAVAGIAAARNNATGVVGVAPGARIWSAKVVLSNNTGWISDAICGLEWVAGNAASIDVVNMSLTGPGSPGGCINDLYHLAICTVSKLGIPVVVAAGNQGSAASGVWFPAAYPETIAVGALVDSDGRPGGKDGRGCSAGTDDTLASFSNTSPDVDIVAPGGCVATLTRTGGVALMNGTSMATPFVTGAIARYKATSPGSNADQARSWLLSSGSRPKSSSVGYRGDSNFPILYLGK